MALNLSTAGAHKALFGCVPKKNSQISRDFSKLCPSSGTQFRLAAAQSEGSQGRVTAEDETEDSAFDDAGKFAFLVDMCMFWL